MKQIVNGFLSKKRFRLHPVTISVLIIFIAIFAYLIGIPFLDLMELKTVDLRFRSRGRISPGSKVVLAVIDEKSIDKEGKWIWPRSKIADLVTKLSRAGAKVIAFDIGFFEPDDQGILRTIEKIQGELQSLDIRNTDFERYLDNLKTRSDNDKLLADAIKNSSARVVLGYFFRMESEGSEHLDEDEINVHVRNIRGSRYRLVCYADKAARNMPFIAAGIPESNISVISNAAEESGFLNMFSDKDGVVRRMPAVLEFKDTLYSPLSLMSLGAYLDSPLSVKVADYGIEEVRIGKISIPTDELGRILINYRWEEKTFPHIPVTDILREKIPGALLKDKIVLVGSTAVGIYDWWVTPFSNVYPGLEIHANIVDSILSKDFLYQPAWAALFDILAIIFAGLLLGIILPKLGVISGIVVSLLIFAGYILFCHYLFSQMGMILNLVYPLSVLVFTYISITAYRYFVEEGEKRFIKNAFSTYLAPRIVEQLIQSPEKLELGGEQRKITAFFSDIEGFTSISEKLEPGELVKLLNDFLTAMTDIILKYEGTVDKFEGDAIVAFFGAPNEMENQAETACMVCIEMQKKLAELREIWKEESKPELKMRIGLCTGYAVVGNMGSENRMDYTMMGDTVNTAARLEGVNKVYGTYILIGETTYKEAGDGIISREIDSVNVIGKKEPVAVYQPIGYCGDIDDRMIKTVEHYAKGLHAYRERDWDKAINSFRAALEITPDDGPSKTMLKRCNEFIENPPDKDWNGSFSMKTK